MKRARHLALVSALAACSGNPTTPKSDAELALAPEITGTLETDPATGSSKVFCSITAQLAGSVQWTDLYLTFFLEVKRTDTGEIVTQPVIAHYFPGTAFVGQLQHEGFRFGYTTSFDFDADVRYKALDGVSHGIVKHSRCAFPKAA